MELKITLENLNSKMRTDVLNQEYALYKYYMFCYQHHQFYIVHSGLQSKSIKKILNIKMASVKSLITILLAIFLMFSLAQNVEAGYKKPPFNGSMFGKRGTSTGKFSDSIIIVEY